MEPTREHWRIEKWAHELGAVPAQVSRLAYDGEPAILTFLIGGTGQIPPEIRPITWESFFAQFDLLQLSMMWDEEGADFSIVKLAQSSAAYPVH